MTLTHKVPGSESRVVPSRWASGKERGVCRPGRRAPSALRRGHRAGPAGQRAETEGRRGAGRARGRRGGGGALGQKELLKSPTGAGGRSRHVLHTLLILEGPQRKAESRLAGSGGPRRPLCEPPPPLPTASFTGENTEPARTRRTALCLTRPANVAVRFLVQSNTSKADRGQTPPSRREARRARPLPGHSPLRSCVAKGGTFFFF